jgi:ATP-dependent Zn protease
MARPKKDGVHINYYINREVKEITDKVYNTHKIMLSEPNHKANLKLIADILLKKKIVSAKELIEAIESNN